MAKEDSLGNDPVNPESELFRMSEFPVFWPKSGSCQSERVARSPWNLAPTREIGVFQGYVAISGRRMKSESEQWVRNPLSAEISFHAIKGDY